MDLFNSREIAAGLWLGIVLVALLLYGESRRAILETLKTLQSVALLILVSTAIAYFSLVVLGLLKIGFWERTLLKDTILWAILAGSVLVFRSLESGYAGSSFRQILRDSVKVIVVIEFLVNTYTFSLLAEVFLWPVLVTVVAIDAVARSEEQFSGFAKVTASTLTLYGLVVIGQAIWRAVSDLNFLASTLSLRGFLLPIVLSLSLIPLSHAIQVYSCYDRIFRRISLSIGAERDIDLERYAKRTIIQRCRLDLSKLQCLCGPNEVRLMQIRTRDDVVELLDTVLESS